MALARPRPVTMSPTLHRRDTTGLVIVTLTVLVSALAYDSLPATLAIHFDASGSPDQTLAKPLALALTPALAALLVVLFRVLPAIDPLGENVESFQGYYDRIAVMAVGVVGYVHLVVVAWNLGHEFSVTQAIVPVLALTYYVAGTVMEHAEQNWFVGIRTPWTLSSQAVWDRTHERTAVLFKLAGVVALLALPFPDYVVAIAVVPIVLVTVVATVYSFVVYRQVSRS